MYAPKHAEKIRNILHQLQDVARGEPYTFFEYVIMDEDHQAQQAERDEYEELMLPT
jgi:hypothetical protein